MGSDDVGPRLLAEKCHAKGCDVFSSRADGSGGTLYRFAAANVSVAAPASASGIRMCRHMGMTCVHIVHIGIL